MGDQAQAQTRLRHFWPTGCLPGPDHRGLGQESCVPGPAGPSRAAVLLRSAAQGIGDGCGWGRPHGGAPVLLLLPWWRRGQPGGGEVSRTGGPPVSTPPGAGRGLGQGLCGLLWALAETRWCLGRARLRVSEEGGCPAGPAPLLGHERAVCGQDVIGAMSGPAEIAELSQHPPWTWLIPLRARRQVVGGGGAREAGGGVQTPEVQYLRAGLLVLLGGEDLVTLASGPGPIRDPSSSAAIGVEKLWGPAGAYLTLARVNKYFARQDAACPHCCAVGADLLHMLWSCPSLCSYWKEVVTCLSESTARRVPFTWEPCILGLFPRDKRHRAAVRFTDLGLITAKRLVTRRWKSPDPPPMWTWKCSFEVWAGAEGTALRREEVLGLHQFPLSAGWEELMSRLRNMNGTPEVESLV
ncbi:hypothetical protein NDU88_006338 [Pleurodeles waltl]|uniref:Reverse transcriptase zinc-binding domain-containing protein n=1 Tax=Pleurodeles waltl TaxID=8319 RepID=A0AAV7TD48_PLEWA|nr:hypothetical protein NDU88_006338 [Pleurodeles waltl]